MAGRRAVENSILHYLNKINKNEFLELTSPASLFCRKQGQRECWWASFAVALT